MKKALLIVGGLVFAAGCVIIGPWIITDGRPLVEGACGVDSEKAQRDPMRALLAR